jgi:hypothetical protein
MAENLIQLVLQMKNSGYTNDQIIQQLQTQGYDSQQIYDSITAADLRTGAPIEKNTPYDISQPPAESFQMES